MAIQIRSALAGAAATALATGAAVVGLGMLDDASAAPASPPADAAPPAGTAYTFVDTDLTPRAESVHYAIPALPPGAYEVSIFAGLEPTAALPDENLYCQVSDSTKLRRTVVATVHWTNSDATFVSGASAIRVTPDSNLLVSCAAEHGNLTYRGDPLRVTFVRLASMTTTLIHPQS